LGNYFLHGYGLIALLIDFACNEVEWPLKIQWYTFVLGLLYTVLMFACSWAGMPIYAEWENMHALYCLVVYVLSVLAWTVMKLLNEVKVKLRKEESICDWIEQSVAYLLNL